MANGAKFTSELCAKDISGYVNKGICNLVHSMKTIGIVHPKGGVGKTVTATNLACAFAKAGNRVLIADGDPQRSAITWCDTEGGLGLDWTTFDVKTKLSKFARKFDVCIVDTAPAHPGHDGEPKQQSRTALTMKSAISASNMVIVPVTMGHQDVWALGDMAELIEQAKQGNAFVLMNRVKPRPASHAMIREGAEAVGIPVFDSQLSDLIAYVDAFGEGCGVVDWSGVARHEKAKREVLALYDEVLKCL